MAVGFFYSPLFLQHDTGPAHPERPERLEALVEAIGSSELAQELEWVEQFTPRAPGSLAPIHDADYVERVKQVCASGGGVLDWGDTPAGARSFDAALAAADAAVEAAARVYSGELARAFVAPRPPGHHAERGRAMGFCIFNNIAVAAAWLLEQCGAGRVAIVDFDVHHGNGTQNAFWRDGRVLFVSTHQYPHYPGTGAAGETGAGPGEGATLNLPMAPGSGDEQYRRAFEDKIIPALEAFGPEQILVSAGFDAHAADPLSSINLTDEGYAFVAAALVGAADRLCGGKLVTILEGGYALDVLTRCVTRHINILAGES